MSLPPLSVLNPRNRIKLALYHLRMARDDLAAAQCPNAADAVRRALKSAEGAQRNQASRDFAAEHGTTRRQIRNAKRKGVRPQP